jgi:uncharacterized protein YdhG (YjbR/CyaY superfamily)
MNNNFNNIDEYIDTFTGELKKQLIIMRNYIKEIIPDAKEVISYNMPAFKYEKVIVYFAGYSKHIGFYPTPVAISHFENRLVDYKYSKGAVQFPINKEMPLELIKKMVLFSKKENTK